MSELKSKIQHMDDYEIEEEEEEVLKGLGISVINLGKAILENI